MTPYLICAKFLFRPQIDAEFAVKSQQFPRIPVEFAKFAGAIFSIMMGAEFAAKFPQFPRTKSKLEAHLIMFQKKISDYK